MTPLLIIPARGGSKGLKRKNLRPLNGKPLIGHTIDAARNSQYGEHVVVTTEDQEIADYASQFVQVQIRPDDMATDKAEVDPLLIYTVQRYEEEKQVKIDAVVLLYPTAPLRGSEEINTCINHYREGGFDSVLTLYEDDKYLWELKESFTRPTNYDPHNRRPRQLEGWNQYAENKAVYVMNKEMLLRTGCRIGEKVGYVLMDPLMSVDIDAERDLILAELILQNKDRLL